MEEKVWLHEATGGIMIMVGYNCGTLNSTGAGSAEEGA